MTVLVQGEPGVLATGAADIDLGAVRAGIVKDPREWRWCGYAEALRTGMCLALHQDWHFTKIHVSNSGMRTATQALFRQKMRTATKKFDRSGSPRIPFGIAFFRSRSRILLRPLLVPQPLQRVPYERYHKLGR